MSISGNLIGSYSQLGKTFIFSDSEGNEVTGVVTDQMMIFDVTDSDVRKGVVYAGNEGVSIGTQEIPPYTYAIIDEVGLCYEVCGTSKNYDDIDGYIIVPKYSSDYIDKDFNVNNGQWYLDASFAMQWMSNEFNKR